MSLSEEGVQHRAVHGGEPMLATGMTVLGQTLGLRVYELDDTNVFYARDEHGRATAVKSVRSGHRLVEQEADALRAAGDRVPEVVGTAEWNGRGILVSEWIFGDEVTAAAASSRGQHGRGRDTELLALVTDVVAAFAEIHAQGVLHGDIHPRNVLVEASGRVRVIGFRLAALSTSAPKGDVVRGGASFTMEPELAAASLRGRSSPPTAAGEQYSVGALVYFLWTGAHTLDFALERVAMLTQIAEADAISFARRNVADFPALEVVLRRAVAKDPKDRFPTLEAFASTLGALLPAAIARDELAAKVPSIARNRAKETARAFLEDCGLGGVAFRTKPRDAPYASIHYGAAGIAYAMYRMATARDDARLLATADVWSQKATVLSALEDGFFATEVEVTAQTVGRASLFHSASGVHAVTALVALASGDVLAAERATNLFVDASRAPCDSLDATAGKASLLAGCAELLDATRGAHGFDGAALVTRGDELRDEIAAAVGSSTFATSTTIRALGFAHGWSGLLFVLLRYAQARNESAANYRLKLDELAELHEPHGAGIRFPIQNRTSSRRTYAGGWCDGAAGHALLWSLAYASLGDARYAVYAERSARAAWSSTTRHGSLCSGLAGIGYACAAAHRVTGDAVWLARARLRAKEACDDNSELFYPDSLFDGAVGAALLHEELSVGQPAMPLFER